MKRKHAEHVPAKLTESEFWTKFFQSHYFHRDRIIAGTKDIFTECGKIDDHQLKQDVAANMGDPLLDIRRFEDNTLEEGFGNSSANKQTVNSGNIVHQSMIKRFNQHSFMVLKTCTDVKTLNCSIGSILNATAAANAAMAAAATANGESGQDKINNNVTNGYSKKEKRALENQAALLVEEGANFEPAIKKARILEKIHFDDLEDSEEATKKPQKLQLSKIERYLHGPVPSSFESDAGQHHHHHHHGHHHSLHNLLDDHQQNDADLLDLDSVQGQIMQEADESWNTRTPHKVLVSATHAVNALGELSPGGALMRGFQEQSLARKYMKKYFK